MKTRKSKRWTNADLLVAFAKYNRQYFGGRLEVAYLCFSSIDGLGHTFRLRTVGKRRSQQDPFGMHISSQLRTSRRLWATTLLHEMVHLEQRCRYSCSINGDRFNVRMKELAEAGAFNGLW